MAERLRVVARLRAAAQVDHAGGHARHHRRHGLALYRRAQGLLPDRGHRLRASASPRRSPTSRSRRWSSGSARSPIIVRKDPAVAYVNSTVGAGGPNPTGNSGRMLVRAQAAGRARQAADGDGAAARTTPTSSPASRSSSSRSRTSISAAAAEEPVSVHAAIERHRRALPAGAGDARQDREARRRCATSPPTSTSRTRR